MRRHSWLAHPQLERIEDFGKLGYGLHFRLTHPKDVDRRLRLLVREGYAIGRGKPDLIPTDLSRKTS